MHALLRTSHFMEEYEQSFCHLFLPSHVQYLVNIEKEKDYSEHC